MKYHYEYRVRCYNLAWGGTTLGPYRSYADAHYEWAWRMNTQGAHWAIEKFRVYDD